MSLMVGPAFTIPGYTTTVPPDYDTECDAAVYEADVVVDHPAFWWHYLAGPLGADREADAAFPVATSELHAMRAVLDDRERWPVVSVCLGGDAWLRIVFRNFEEDMGLDFVEERPGQPVKVYTHTQDEGESALTWTDLLAVAQLPGDRLTWAQRFILILPMLERQELPDDAGEVLGRALEEIGASNVAAVVAALLEDLDWRTR